MSIFTADEIAALKANETLAWPNVNLVIKSPQQLDLMPDAQFQTFTIQNKVTTKVGGNIQTSYPNNGTLVAVLGIPAQEQTDQYEQAQHPIHYTLNHKGAPVAKIDDRFALGNRHFYVMGVLDPSALQTWCQYLVQERTGL